METESGKIDISTDENGKSTADMVKEIVELKKNNMMTELEYTNLIMMITQGFIQKDKIQQIISTTIERNKKEQA